MYSNGSERFLRVAVPGLSVASAVALVLGRAWRGYADVGDVFMDVGTVMLPVVAWLSVAVPDTGLRTARLGTGTATAICGAAITVAYGLDIGAKDQAFLSPQNLVALLLGTVATGAAAALADLRIADLEAAEADRRHRAVLAALLARDESRARRARPAVVLGVAVLAHALMRRRQIAPTPTGTDVAR